MKRTAFAIIVALLLSGCTLGPDYLRPKILIPDNHRGVVGAAGGGVPRRSSLVGAFPRSGFAGADSRVIARQF